MIQRGLEPLSPSGLPDATRTHTETETETETSLAAGRSLRRKHTGFPLTEAAPSLRKNNEEVATTEEAATLTEPGRHGCGAPQLHSPPR